MGLLQLLNIALFWVFFGFLTSYFAKKRGHHPIIWFGIGLLLGIMGLLLVFLVPPKQKQHAPQKNIKIVSRSDAWLKMWYYLDQRQQQQGPLEFPDFIKVWKEQQMTDQCLIWGEGMEEWKKLSDLPDLVKEMEQI